MIYNFVMQLERGKLGEDLVYKHLRKMTGMVVDVRDVAHWRSVDVDFLLFKDRMIWQLEVKTDDQICSTGNFFIETMSNIGYGKLGWFFVTKADWIYYVDVKNRECYILSMDYLRQVLPNVKKEYKRCKNEQYESEGYIINKSDLKYELVRL
jgi:hypothetical protein